MSWLFKNPETISFTFKAMPDEKIDNIWTKNCGKRRTEIARRAEIAEDICRAAGF